MKSRRGGARPGAGRKRVTPPSGTTDPEIDRAFDLILQLASDNYEMTWDDSWILSLLLVNNAKWQRGRRSSHGGRGRHVSKSEKQSLAFRSYLLCVTEPQKYPKDSNAVTKVAELHRVNEKTVWNARAVYKVDPQKMRALAHALATLDFTAEQRLLQRIDAGCRSVGVLD
jgi:hypothetical protein